MIPAEWQTLLEAIEATMRRSGNRYYMPVTLILAIQYLEGHNPGVPDAGQPIPCGVIEEQFGEAMRGYGQRENFYEPVWSLRDFGDRPAWAIHPASAQRLTNRQLRTRTLVFCDVLRPGLQNAGQRGLILDYLQNMIPA